MARTYQEACAAHVDAREALIDKLCEQLPAVSRAMVVSALNAADTEIVRFIHTSDEVFDLVRS